MSLPITVRLSGIRYGGELLSCNGLYYNTVGNPSHYIQISGSSYIHYNTDTGRWEIWDSAPILVAYAPGDASTFPSDSGWIVGYGFDWATFDPQDFGDDPIVTRTGDPPCDYDPPVGDPYHLLDEDLATGDGIMGGTAGHWEFDFDKQPRVQAVALYVSDFGSLDGGAAKVYYWSGSNWDVFGEVGRNVRSGSWAVLVGAEELQRQNWRLELDLMSQCGVGIHQVRFGQISDTEIDLSEFEIVKNYGDSVIEIGDVYDLEAIGRVSLGLTRSYKQTADIDASVGGYDSGSGFPTLGHSGYPFTGFYDGQGFTINNLFIDVPNGNYRGLFARNQGTIKRLGFYTPNISSRDYTGVLCGIQTPGGVIEDCYVRGGTVQGWDHVGGLVGRNDKGIIRRTYSNAAVSGTGGDVGGLVGSKVEGGAYAD